MWIWSNARNKQIWYKLNIVRIPTGGRLVGGWPIRYLHIVEELNPGQPKTNPSSGREEDLNPGPPDYKSNALPLGHARLPKAFIFVLSKQVDNLIDFRSTTATKYAELFVNSIHEHHLTTHDNRWPTTPARFSLLCRASVRWVPWINFILPCMGFLVLQDILIFPSVSYINVWRDSLLSWLCNEKRSRDDHAWLYETRIAWYLDIFTP